ncbi:MAG: aldo/keto reductase [Oscillospiraceae bacterium]|jgi:aryl-alcohol dehydrogenase-like predicted oxidoreductase|nr:aldo/keto reductase [Oscillospiraceae bacterium]
MIKTVTISNQWHAIEMSQIVIGENGVSDPARQSFAYRCFDRYLDRGGNCFDTARLYGGGRSEAALGAYLKGKRDKVYIVTKCGHHDMAKPPNARLTERDILGDVDASLRALGCEYTDVLLLHRDDIYTPVEAIMPVLHTLVATGKVRLLGASNWTAGRIASANAFAEANGLTPFSVSQVLWNLGLTTAAQTGDLTHCVMDTAEYLWYKAQEFPVMAWTATGKGFFAKTVSGQPMSAHAEQYYGWLPENKKRAFRAQAIAEAMNVPVSAVVLNYVLSGDVPGIGVTAFSSDAQFDETMRAADFTLNAEQRRFLEEG